jgi:hypothetical protein
MIILATEELKKDGRRLRERRVNEKWVADHRQGAAVLFGETMIDVTHGGAVSGRYGHAAETEGLVTVAFPNGDVVQFGARLNASNATRSGVLAACVGEQARAYVDPRFGESQKERARLHIIDAAVKKTLR